MAKTTTGTKAKSKKSTKLPPEVYTPLEIRQLITACGKRSASGLRNAALIATLFGTGLRISEALALKPADVDLVAGTVKVNHGKGDKCRTVGLDPSCQAQLEIWLQRRTAIGLNGREPIFCIISKKDNKGIDVFGGSMCDAYIRAMLPRLGKRAGIDKRIHAHGMRHSLAANMSSDGEILTTISSQLGHSSVAVTDKYLAKIAPTKLVEAMRSKSRLPD